MGAFSSSPSVITWAASNRVASLVALQRHVAVQQIGGGRVTFFFTLQLNLTKLHSWTFLVSLVERAHCTCVGEMEARFMHHVNKLFVVLYLSCNVWEFKMLHLSFHISKNAINSDDHKWILNTVVSISGHGSSIPPLSSQSGAPRYSSYGYQGTSKKIEIPNGRVSCVQFVFNH